jgi:hypothetical protein
MGTILATSRVPGDILLSDKKIIIVIESTVDRLTVLMGTKIEVIYYPNHFNSKK